MKGKHVTCLIPSIMGTEYLLGCLFSVINQKTPPLRVIVGDCSEKGIESLFATKRFCRFARIDVLRLPVGTNLHLNTKAILEAVDKTCDLVWVLNDDAWPHHKCLHRMLKTMKKFGASAVTGTKTEVTRKNVFGGKDWNQSGDSMRVQRLNWCDMGNLLVDRKMFALGTEFAHRLYKETGQDFPGEDVPATAAIAMNYVCVSEPRAIAYHLPLTPERWTDLSEADNRTLGVLKERVTETHLDWMKRTLSQSDW